MLDAFKQLVESGVMTEETKTVIESAFTTKLQETREKVTAELREEFAQKYNHDKTIMVEAIDRMLSERLTAEMDEFAQDKRALLEARIAYRKKIKEDAQIMDTFVSDQLSKEIVEFQSDRKKVAENFGKLEEFVIHALAKEIKESAQAKKTLVKQRSNLLEMLRLNLTKQKKHSLNVVLHLLKALLQRNLKLKLCS